MAKTKLPSGAGVRLFLGVFETALLINLIYQPKSALTQSLEKLLPVVAFVYNTTSVPAANRLHGIQSFV
jgi:hypothetical protein